MENKQCIETLKQELIEPLCTILNSRNVELTRKITELHTRCQTMKNVMVSMLNLYPKIHVAFDEDAINKEPFAVEIAKMSYSNLVDNNSWRYQPPIANVLKDEFRYIKCHELTTSS